MKPLEVFIAEPSFIIREGIKTMLSQAGLTYRVEETNAVEEKLVKLLSRSKARLAFINPEQIQDQFLINRTDNVFRQTLFIAITNAMVELDVFGRFDFVLDIKVSKAELMAQFDSIMRRAGIEPRQDEMSGLSQRETDVLRFVALGMTNNEISEKLFISVHTVMTHRKNINRKLGIKSVPGLTVYAILNKLISAEQVKGT